ncbi:MAG: ATP-binding protein [Pyrinomonadaceae bacterium]
MRFQHKLAGEDEWSASSPLRSVNFANLAPGNYQFLARAITSDGVTSQKAASVSFKILSPIYLRWWFLLLTSIIIGGLIYFFYRSRFLRLLEMERIRTRIATDLHDDIGANLTRISLLSEVANQQATNNGGENILTSIADIARESVASMNDIVWAIAPEHDSLLDLTRRMRQHAEEVFTYREIDLDFNAPASDSKLSVNVRRDILLIFKEAVSNAAKYSDCRRVKIDFRIEHSILSLKISDDGKGFDYSKNSSGNGLLNMKTRAEKIGGKFEIQSVVEKGTSITVTIPHV